MRLTNAIKKQIVRNIVSKKVDPGLEDAKKALAARIHADRIKHVKKGWEKYREYMMVEKSVRVRTHMHGEIFLRCEPIPVMGRWEDIRISEYELDEESTRLLDQIKAAMDLEKDINAITWDVLNSVTTDRQLLEMAPDLEDLLPEKAYGGSVPVALDTIKRLNTILRDGRGASA